MPIFTGRRRTVVPRPGGDETLMADEFDNPLAGSMAAERSRSDRSADGIGPLYEPAGWRWLRWAARVAAVGYTGALVAVTHMPNVPEPPGPMPLVPPDKLAHVVLFALLCWLLVLAKPLGRRAPHRLTLLVAAGVSIALAWGVEQTQPMTGRTGDWADFLAGLGGILGIYVIAGARPLPRGWLGPMWLLRLAGVLGLPVLVAAALTPWGKDWMIVWAPTFGLSPTADKQAHYLIAAGLVWLLALVAPLGRLRPRISAAAGLLAVTASSVVIEYIQPHTGRGQPSPGDVWAHMRGVNFALMGWAIAATLRSGVTALASVPALRRGVGLAIGTRAGRTDEAVDDTDDPDDGAALAGHASLISGLTLISRVTGLGRDAVLAALFGVSAIADAFFIGFLVPNLFRRLFGEGALAAAFIPRYTELRQSNPELAKRFAGLSLAGLVALLAALTLIGEAILFAMQQSGLAAEGGSGALAIELTMFMLPYMPLVCAVALIGGMLQVHRRFGPPAAAPIALNLLIITAALGANWWYQDLNGLAMLARVTAAAVLVAGVVQLLWQWWALRQATKLSLKPAGVAAPMKRMAKAMLPLMLGLAVFQINAFLDSFVALLLSTSEPGATFTLLGWTLPYPMKTGAVASLQWAQRLYQFPLGVFGIAIATAIFPALSDAAAARAHDPAGRFAPAAIDDRLARILRQGLRLTLFIGLPATLGLLLVRTPLVRVIYERGAFSLDDSQRVAMILAGYASAVWAYSLAHVLTRCFYAVGDEKAPVRISASMVGLNLALNAALIWPLGVAGLAWSTAICAAGQALWLLHDVRRHVALPIDRAVKQSWARTGVLSGAMGIGVGAMAWWIDATALGWWGALGLLAELVILGMAIVLGGAWLWRSDELTWLLNRRNLP